MTEGLLAGQILFRSRPFLPPAGNQKSSQVTAHIPQKISVPKLGIEANIYPVRLDESGEMKMSEDADAVAWYEPGGKLGEKGSVVLAGHLDSKTGPAVFYRLSQLAAGDEIKVVDENNREYWFRVVKKETFEETRFPFAEVFGQSDKQSLNLITCRGRFDQESKRYDKRIVVFSEREN